MPQTRSYGERYVFVLTCELIPKGKVFTFCDHLTYCEYQTVRRKVFSCLLLLSTSRFDHGAYGVRGLNYTLFMRQNGANLPLIYSFPL